MGANQALEAARALALTPSLAPAMREARLPAGVTALLRFLAGEIDASELTAGDATRLQDIVERYVFAVMLHPGAAPERILGLHAGASREEMRAHMRLLMIWLHPDRAGDAWRATHSARVLEAWRKLSSAPGRAAARAPATAPRRRRRPQTRAIKLAWVARPVSRRRRRRGRATIACAAALACALAALAAVDNPLRRWAQRAVAAPAPAIVKTEAWPGP